MFEGIQKKELPDIANSVQKEAVDRMMDSSSDAKYNELMDLTFNNQDKFKPIVTYLDSNRLNLSPEEIFFL